MGRGGEKGVGAEGSNMDVGREEETEAGGMVTLHPIQLAQIMLFNTPTPPPTPPTPSRRRLSYRIAENVRGNFLVQKS